MATIERIGSSTRIEGSRLPDRDVERPLSKLQIKSFETRGEQEVADCAEVTRRYFFWNSKNIQLNQRFINKSIAASHVDKTSRCERCVSG